MSQLLRARCPECNAGLRIPVVDEDELITCPKCGAEFAADSKPSNQKRARNDDDDDDENEDGDEDAPRRSKNGKRKKEPESANQTVLIAIIIGVSVLASIAAIAVPLLMKKGDEDNSQASAAQNVPNPNANPSPVQNPLASTPTPLPKPTTDPNNPMGTPVTPNPMQPGGNPNKFKGGPDGLPKTNPPVAGENPTPPGAGKPGANPGGRPGGLGQVQPPKPPPDLNKGKTTIVGTWETSTLNPRTRKIMKITTFFSDDNSYSVTNEEVDAKKQEFTGSWDMAVQGENYIVSIAVAPVRDGKASGNKTTSLAAVRFEGNDTMFMAAPGMQQTFTRKK